jgi:hypothetical protein
MHPNHLMADRQKVAGGSSVTLASFFDPRTENRRINVAGLCVLALETPGGHVDRLRRPSTGLPCRARCFAIARLHRLIQRWRLLRALGC